MLTLKQRSDKLWHVAHLFHCRDAVSALLFFDQRDYPTVPGICTNPDCRALSNLRHRDGIERSSFRGCGGNAIGAATRASSVSST